MYSFQGKTPFQATKQQAMKNDNVVIRFQLWCICAWSVWNNFKQRAKQKTVSVFVSVCWPVCLIVGGSISWKVVHLQHPGAQSELEEHHCVCERVLICPDVGVSVSVCWSVQMLVCLWACVDQAMCWCVCECVLIWPCVGVSVSVC